MFKERLYRAVQPAIEGLTAQRWREKVYTTGGTLLSEVLLRVEAAKRHALLEKFTTEYGMSGGDLALYYYPNGLDMADVTMVDQRSPEHLTTRRPEAYNTSITVQAGFESFTYKIPIMNAAMASIGGAEFAIEMGKQGGMPVLHRMWLKPDEFAQTEEEKNKISLDRQIAALKKCKEEKIEPFVAIPVNTAWADAVIAVGAQLLVVDTLKMSTAQSMALLQHVKRNYPSVWICTGNTVSPKEAWDFALAGADAIKVGIGPGAVCTTYETTGHGSCQWSATALIAAMLHDPKNAQKLQQKNGKVPMVIADGGIKNTGDVGKLIGAGADAVMIGTRFAGTKESGLEVHRDNQGHSWVEHWGQASEHATGRGADGKVAVEGVKTRVPFRGNLADVLRQWHNGLCASYAVTGATRTVEMQRNARFIRTTTHAAETGKPLAKLAHDNGQKQ